MANTPIKALPRRSLETRAADELREAIVLRRYEPGSRLTETQLAALLGVSRGTARSALQKLLSEGLVAQRPYASWEVVGLSAADAWELFTLRGALEGLAAELVTAALSEQRLASDLISASYEAIVAACERGDEVAADESDFGFHKTVVTCSRHGRLLEQYERVEAQIRTLIAAANESPRAILGLVAEHRPLLDVLLAGEPMRAGALFRNHALENGRTIMARIESSVAA